jgi:hypothetical protein
VITSYYNPAGYRRRLQNFRAFRRNLSAPLLVVELTPKGCGELQDDDADIVVRLGGDDRIWQKERLLNIGASMLPPHVRYVAWVDADLLFSDPDWPARARAVLDEHGGMVQLFDTAHHLPQDIDPLTVEIAQCAVAAPFLSGISIARSAREGRFEDIESGWCKSSTQIESNADRYNVFGFAWAARRDALVACGLYEGNVVGGSDALNAFAHLGRLEQCWVNRPYTKLHQAHVRQWALNARRGGLFAHLDDLPQAAYHLWHGTMINRNYVGRYQILIGHNFDPERDLIVEQDRPLRWVNPGSAMAKAVGEYFFSRREDGD